MTMPSHDNAFLLRLREAASQGGPHQSNAVPAVARFAFLAPEGILGDSHSLKHDVSEGRGEVQSDVVRIAVPGLLRHLTFEIGLDPSGEERSGGQPVVGKDTAIDLASHGAELPEDL
ncbi:MAG: hypothetical protein L0H31_07940 [Nocardioidaceae bacterium]|nr:hypothetical protein [Nocardioidaceae bacterium]